MQNNRQSDAKKVKNPTVIQTCSSSQQQSHCGGGSERKNGKNMSSNRNKQLAVAAANNNSSNSTPTKTDTEFKDSSDSDEESVSEVDSFPIDQESIEIPESYSDSTINEEDDDDNEDVSINYEDDEDGDEEDSGGSEGEDESADDAEPDQTSHDTKARLEALLEAADEAALALTKKSSNGTLANLKGHTVISRSLIAACSDNDMTAVRKILGENGQYSDGTDESDSLLSLACSAGYLELAQVLLAMSAKIDDRGIKNECTPLMEAASAGHHDIIDLLIRHGAEVDATSSSGNTPLMYACAGGHVLSVKVLLSHGANVEDHNENGHTPLMEAASAGHVAVARLLLENGAGINTHSNEFKESALTLACYKGHLDMVRFLLEAGADQEHKTDEMHTALMEASMDGHVEVARLLLDSGAQVNMPTDSFESPLTLAACGGHVDLALLLIERGANIEEVNDEGYTPLMEAAREGHEEMVALLLSQNANINAQTEETQETALTLACCGGFLEVADYLIKHGADIELGASTPLMEAAQEGHLELVKFLLENRANVHAQTQTGDTALTYACENGHTDVAEILLLYGAELEHESEGGRTPLMKACRAGHLCTVKFLLGRNAEINKPTTNNDHTPLSLACAGGHQPVVELLLANGADMFHKLKDNSTMLIEAAKGGHLSVVQLLLDYPTSLNATGQTDPSTMPPLVLKNNLHLMSSANQVMATPPGLPDAIRTNQFSLQTQQQQQQTTEIEQAAEFLPYTHHDYSPASFTLSGEASGGDVQKSVAYEESPNSLIAQMRKLATNTNLNKGFKDGLMQGLINNNANAAAAVAAAAAAVASQQNGGSGTTSTTKFSNESNMVPSNVTAAEPFDGFSQAALLDHHRLGNYFGDHQNDTIEDIKKKLILGTRHIVGLGCDGNAWPGPIPNHDPSQDNFSVLNPTEHLNETVFPPSIPTTTPAPSKPTVPGEVSQSTAIADRPKVKPVSKKDGKYIKKSSISTILQTPTPQNQQHQGTLPLIPVTIDEQNQHQNVLNMAAMQQHQVQGQQTQMQTVAQSVVDAQQQAKFVFNVDTEKPTQSLQLLFQLPAVHQGGQTQPPTASIITQQQQQQQQQQTQTSQVVAQTQTCQQQQQQQQRDAHSIQVLRPNVLEMPSSQHCTQHQVATQTSTQPNIQMPPSIAPRHVQTEVKGKLTMKKGEKRLKDKRFPTRPTPTGQQSGSSSTGGFQFDQSGLPSPQFTAAAATQQNASTVAAATATEPVHKIDVDSETDSNHDTALTLACAGGHEELVVLLLERGASIEHRDKKGFTPLILAATAGHVKVVEILIREKADLEAQSERTKDTPLSLACSGGRYEVVELLLKNNANKEHRNVSDYTPLSLAASGGYVNIIKMLLNHGAEINSRTGSKLGISPLMLAAMNGHTQAVKLLLDMGSDINAQIETNRNTALTLACFQGRHEVVSLLLDRKANVEHRAKTGLTPLMEAASGGYIEVGRVLIDKGADVNAAPVPSSRDTALTIASDKGHLKFVELLLSRSALVEVKNKKGNSPLWLAAHGGHLGVVEVLHEYNADIDSQDNRKVSCLMAAFRRGHIKVVEWMVEHVSQFPSDQEMTRFINTISDKDILTKCHECVKIIKAAKETQARKAYLNASILLRELETEKNREEQRKAAAAKRRERKKRRKQEKKELQRKAEGKDEKNNKTRNQKDEEPEESDDDDSDDSDDDIDEEEDVVSEPPKSAPSSAALHPVHHQPELREKEEGDSGIDANSQGSCSSSDAKPQTSTDPKPSKRRNKQKKQPINTNNRSSNSPEVVVVAEKLPPQVVIEKPKKPIPSMRKPEPKKNVEKENLAPKEDVKQVTNKAPEKKETLVQQPQLVKPEARKVFNSSYRHSAEHTVEVTEAPVFHSSASNKKLNIKQHPSDTISPNKNHGKREEGWKEVTRKSSVQQNLPQEVKKVYVPTNAISRVIGRGGSNINAIRAATGAIIEVEKQGKIQQDRCITIKGYVEATKQAQLLIDTLINDSDVDILHVLEREGIGKVTQQTSGQIVIGTWDKSKPSSTTSSQDGDVATTKKRVGTKGRSTASKNLFEVRAKAPSTSAAPRVRVSSPVKSAPKVSTNIAAVKSTQSFASRVSATVATTASPAAVKKIEKSIDKPVITSKPLPTASCSSVSVATTITTTTAKLEQRSITPIGSARNVTPTPVMPTSVSAPNSAVKSRNTDDSVIGSQMKGNLHGQQYSLFNDTYGGQWDNKQYTASIAAHKTATVNPSYIGSDPVIIDASKAPGYRGTNISSPVSSKTSSQSITPPSSMQPPTSISTNTIQPITKPYSSSQNEGAIPVGKPAPIPAPIQPPGTANNNLAVQRPSVPMRPISDSFGAPPQQPQATRERLYDPFPSPTYYNDPGYQQQQQPQPMASMNSVPLPISRLNPKASSFSSSMQPPPLPPQQQQPPPSAVYSKQPQTNHYNPNMYNAYQQPPPQTRSHGGAPMYNQRPPIAQWYQEMGPYTPRADIMNFENGQMPPMGSPSMSPNSGIPPNQNGLVDDARKHPRPIGTERSWKNASYPGGSVMQEENGNLNVSSWQMENMKQQQMPWIQPQPIGPRGYYDDINSAPPGQEHFPTMVEYPTPMGPNQPNMGFIRSHQYQPYLPGPPNDQGQNNMEQMTWEQDKPVWPKWN